MLASEGTLGDQVVDLRGRRSLNGLGHGYANMLALLCRGYDELAGWLRAAYDAS